MGARPLERFIEDNISILIAKNILNDFFKPKSLYEIDFKDKNWDIKKI
jgi:ATP-dependent Clp protease ATP-binding subunit ClpA